MIPSPAPTEDAQADILEQDAATDEPIQAIQDDIDALLVEQTAPAARERQPETQWQQDTQEPEHYQPAQGQSRLGRDMQTGDYVDVTQAARRQGLYIIGIQGTGKTGLIENLMIQDIKQGMGVGLLDPHGDLTQAVLSRLPDHREQDVIYLDIADYHYPFGLNLFACSDITNPLEVQKTVDRVMHVFEKVVSVSQDTPLILEYLRYCTYVLIANQGYTMADIRLLLKQRTCRQALLRNVALSEVRDFWDDYDQLPPKEQNERSEYVLRRVRNFLQPLTYNIVGQSTATIDIRQVMDERKILLVKLSTQLSSVTSLIGSMFIALFLHAANSRADLPTNKRKQFNLYADEFQRFATEDFATLLEEARKYGIATTIAHQNRGQLDTENRQLAANLKDRTRSVANLVVFKVNSKDADELAGEFDITPQEAWEEELEEERVEVREKERVERIEEQVTDDAEEEIKEISQNPVDFLVSARGTHGSASVRKVTQAILIPLAQGAEGKGLRFKPSDNTMDNFFASPVAKQYPGSKYDVGPLYQTFEALTGKNLLNTLLVDVMEGRVSLRTADMAKRVHEIVRTLGGFVGWRGMHSYSRFVGREQNREPFDRIIRCLDALVWALIAGQYQPNRLPRYDAVILPGLERDLVKALVACHCPKSSDTYPEAIKYNREEEQKWTAWATAEKGVIVFFVSCLKTLCEELAKKPIMVSTGQKRMVPRKRTQIHYLPHPEKTFTHPRIAITHPQRSYADMLNEVASQLTSLPAYTARVRITTETGLIEHTIRTLDPKKEPGKILFGEELEERIARIQKHNRTPDERGIGYCRSRQEVEAEIIKRQEQYRKPPEEPPISRRQRN
jgi:hypothetical protein